MTTLHKQPTANYLIVAQKIENLNADREGRKPETVTLDTPVTLRTLITFLTDPRGEGL